MLKVISELCRKKKYFERIKYMVEKDLEKTSVTGNIRIVNNHGCDAYYLCTQKGDTKGRYLRKQELAIAQAIVQRDYNQKVMKCVEAWIKWIDDTISTMPQESMSTIFDKSKKRKILINPYELPDNEYRKKWESIEYTGKEFKEGTPEIYTEKGERVRSKTEKMIADKLYMLGIPYRYEYPLRLEDGRRVVYPDFTVLKLDERKEIIWEHFGMMDNPEYADMAVRKIQNYSRNGYYDGDNILNTFEINRTPVDMVGIQSVLERMVI